MRKIGGFLILIFILFSCSNDKKIEGLKFINLNEKEVNLANHKLSVFYFLAPECPLSQNYTKEINDINNQFKNDNVKFYAVFSGLTYSVDEMKTYKEDYSIKIEGLKDEEYVLAKHFKATITPEVFVIDKNEEVIYSGKIDNWIESLGVKRQNVTELYLKDAISKYLSGKEIIINKTEAVGCVLE